MKPATGTTLFLLVVMLVPAGLSARPTASLKYSTLREENPKGAREFLVLPFLFSTDSMGFTMGAGSVAKGYVQEQLLVGGAGWGSVEGSWGMVGGIWDYDLPVKRLFFSVMGTVGYYSDQRAYANFPRPPGEPKAGSNGSDKDDYRQDSGYDNWVEFRLEWVLPLGAAREEAIMTYHLKRGLLVEGASGGKQWNPLKSGVTVVFLQQYNRFQSLELDQGKVDYTVHSLEMGFLYDNTDFPVNPSRGSRQSFAVTRDFGWGDVSTPWTFVEFEASKFFCLGENKWARQQVLALNFWTGDTPTHEMSLDADGNVVYNGTPPFTQGATLGGFYRMRAYPNYRFNDRSVIYSTAEFRFTPHWNPIGECRFFKWLQMDWWQFVSFVEGGRVADNYDFGKLFSSWKVDGGLGIRAMMAGGVVRLDCGVSSEGASLWAMFGQPF